MSNHSAKLRATVCRPRESRIARRRLPCLFDCHLPAAAWAVERKYSDLASAASFVFSFLHGYYKKEKTNPAGLRSLGDYLLSDRSIGR